MFTCVVTCKLERIRTYIHLRASKYVDVIGIHGTFLSQEKQHTAKQCNTLHHTATRYNTSNTRFSREKRKAQVFLTIFTTSSSYEDAI